MKQKAPPKKQARKHKPAAQNEWNLDLPEWEVNLPSFDTDLPAWDFDLPEWEVNLPKIENITETELNNIIKAGNQRNSKAKKHKQA